MLLPRHTDLTDRGPLPVEQLAIGQPVMTLSGEMKPIKWIGRRAYAGRFLAGNPKVLPIRILAGALADDIPARDLFVSPEHALLIDEVPVPARLLLNDASIVQVQDVDAVEYFHIELEQHDIIFAEHAPAESFVDCDSRGMFHNAAEFAACYPNDRRPAWQFCAPRLEPASAQLADIRTKLAARAGIGETCCPPALLRGSIDLLDRTRVEGWVFDPTRPTQPVRLAIYCDDALVGHVVADRFRADLADVGYLGEGRCAFAFGLPVFPDPLREHVVELRRAGMARRCPVRRRRWRRRPGLTAHAARRWAICCATPRRVHKVRRRWMTRSAIWLSRSICCSPRERAWMAARAVWCITYMTAGEGCCPANRCRARCRRCGRGRCSSMRSIRPPGPTAGPMPRWTTCSRYSASGSRSALPRRTIWATSHGRARGLAELGIRALTAPWYGSVEEVLRRHADHIDLIYLHRVTAAAPYIRLVRYYHARAMVLYSVADLHHLRLARQSVVEDRPELARESTRLLFEELVTARLADAVITHSAAEAALLRSRLPNMTIAVVPWSGPHPMSQADFADRRAVLFVGSFEHDPNMDAVHWLAETIVPLVQRTIPRSSFG